jgi:hypothetical protein
MRPWVGHGWGSFTLPEHQSLNYVSELNHAQHFISLGMQYTSKAQHPYQPNQMGMKIRTLANSLDKHQKEHHELLIDGSGKPYVWIKSVGYFHQMIGGSKHQVIEQNQTIKIQQNYEIAVKQDQYLSVKKEAKWQVKLAQTKVSKNAHWQAGSNIVYQTDQTHHINSDNAAIKAPKITLSVGTSKIILDSAGATVNTLKVKINSSGKKNKAKVKNPSKIKVNMIKPKINTGEALKGFKDTKISSRSVEKAKSNA